MAAVAIGIAVLLGLAVLPRLSPASSSSGMEGKPAPDFTLPVVHNGDEGARMALSDLKGKAVILDFWASWCGVCQAQTPIIERISQRYRDRGLVVLGVNVDDPPGVARAAAARGGMSFPIVLDADSDASAKYGVTKLPSLVIIDREGNVVSYTSGLVDEGSLDELVATAMM